MPLDDATSLDDTPSSSNGTLGLLEFPEKRVVEYPYGVLEFNEERVVVYPLMHGHGHASVDFTTFQALRTFLVKGARISGVFELALAAEGDQLGLAKPKGGIFEALTADQILELVADYGGTGKHVRLLVDDGFRYVKVLKEVARKSQRDILVVPEGAKLQVVPDRDGTPTVVAVARSTGREVRWQVIQPGSVAPRPAARISYRLTNDGKVLPRTVGLVALNLPAKSVFIFTDLNLYEWWAGRISSMRTSRSDLVTIVARYTVGSSQPFALTKFYDAELKQNGHEFARLLTDQGIARGRKLQLALTYESATSDTDIKALAGNIQDLAVGIGATEIYVNPPDDSLVEWNDSLGEAFVVSGPGGQHAAWSFIPVRGILRRRGR